MAWKLRQPFEGDRIITVADVPDSAECWVDGSGNYVPNSIAIKIDGTEHILSSVINLDLGFLGIQVPSGVYIKPNTTVEVYAVCETDPESHTVQLLAKPVDFQVYSGVIKACSPQIALNSDINEYIRFFLTGASGNFFTASWTGGPLTMSDFSYQSEDTGNIASTSGGVFSRPAVSATSATLISNGVYAGTPTLTIIPSDTSKYFTTRLGYVELIFDNGNLKYNNYMVASEFEVAAGTYVAGDTFTIDALNQQYVVRKNGTVLFSKNKNITYTVSGGSVVPATSTVGTPVAWNLPTTAGQYTFTGTLGDSIGFQTTVNLHSCADAVNDTFTGTYNAPYSGNVSTNDTACVGENTYYELVPASTPIGGSVVVNQNGTFTFTPTPNFNSAASFQYNIKCGSSFETAEVVDSATATINYFDSCNGVVANWVDVGNTRCQNCTEEKEQRDTNSQCTGNANRWVVNPGGSACTTAPNLVPTGQTRCQNCVSEREVQDLNICSPTYTQKSWQATTGVCDTQASWVDNGQFRCQACVEEKQQYDNKPCSPTFNTTRWVENPIGTQCNRNEQWVNTNEFSCINCVEKRQQINVSVCSPTYNQTRLIDNPGGTACNTSDTWVDTGVTRCNNGVHEKQQTSINACSSNTERWVATGLQVCGCIAQFAFKNLCEENEELISVVVTRTDVVEPNRLISYGPTVITYAQSIGNFNYLAKLGFKLPSGETIVRSITLKNSNCNPVI